MSTDFAWAPTCFGNVVARDFVFSMIHAIAGGCDIPDIETPELVLAYAGLVVASAGDYSLLSECGFAADFVKSNPLSRDFELKTIERLTTSLRSIRDDSKLLQYWKRRRQSKLFHLTIDHLIRQLNLFPKCKKTVFPKMTKKELSRIVESIGDNFFDGPRNTLSISDITGSDMLQMGRFRGVKAINFLPLTNAESDHVFDLVVRFAIQNWSDSVTSLNFGCIGTLDGDRRFEFPRGIQDLLQFVNLVVFESTGFIATNEIVLSILSNDLQVIRLGHNRLTPDVFDAMESKCKCLEYFFVERSFKCTNAFLRRALDFQRAHMQTKMVVHGQDMKGMLID